MGEEYSMELKNVIRMNEGEGCQSYAKNSHLQAPPDLGCSNKGKIFISKESPEIVLSAYQRQFKNNFLRFLHLRGLEVVDEGRMVLVLAGRRSKYLSTDDGIYLIYELLTKVLMKMAMKGLVEKEIDSYNVPYYCPSMEELEDLVKQEGSFHIKHIEVFHVNCDIDGDGRCSRGNKIAKRVQAFLEPMFAAHFGEYIIQPLFEGLEKLLDEFSTDKNIVMYNLLVSLKKNT